MRYCVYHVNISLTRKTCCHSFMALNKVSDVSAADWPSQTHVKKIIVRLQGWLYGLFTYLFISFYWAGFVAQRERAQQDFKVPYKVPHITHPHTYERRPQHRDHPTLIWIVRGFFNFPQNYPHSRNCETGPSQWWKSL